MRKLSFLAAVVLAATAFGAGAWWTGRSGNASAAQQGAAYACPMHPQYRSDHPGDCPSCGMRLEPVKSDGGVKAHGALALPPGAVQVSAERQQAVGVRLGTAERVAGARTVRTTGRVAANENATYAIVAGTSGWIRSVGKATTGSLVRKDERLASLYSPEFASVTQSYYAGLDTSDLSAGQQLVDFNRRRIVEGVQRFADTLRNMGVSEGQLVEMAKTRELLQDIHIVSPVDGFVLQRSVTNGLRFDRGFEFYRIADLDRVWILADVYEHQLPFLRRARTARVTTAQENGAYTAIVSDAEPIFDEATLILKLRLETGNPELVLKPGMFVDVEFPIDLPTSIAVPADAIVDSGLRKTVFVDRGNGYFEPRQVETGWRIGNEVEIVRGLMAGERIVISGTFLVDSESRMRAAAQGIFGEAEEDPVCGMQVDEMRARAAGRTFEHGGKTYFFCADECRRQFQENPSRYLRGSTTHGMPAASPKHQPHEAPAHEPPKPGTAKATAGADVTATDPICGMTVNVKDATAAGRMLTRAGRSFYFCSDHCKKAFEKP